MLDRLPFLTWIAAITSAVLLATAWYFDDLRGFSLAAFLGWFLLAAYCQFLGGSPVVSAVGLLLQTFLAVVLLIRWKAGR